MMETHSGYSATNQCTGFGRFWTSLDARILASAAAHGLVFVGTLIFSARQNLGWPELQTWRFGAFAVLHWLVCTAVLLPLVTAQAIEERRGRAERFKHNWKFGLYLVPFLGVVFPIMIQQASGERTFKQFVGQDCLFLIPGILLTLVLGYWAWSRQCVVWERDDLPENRAFSPANFTLHSP